MLSSHGISVVSEVVSSAVPGTRLGHKFSPVGSWMLSPVVAFNVQQFCITGAIARHLAATKTELHEYSLPQSGKAAERLLASACLIRISIILLKEIPIHI